MNNLNIQQANGIDYNVIKKAALSSELLQKTVSLSQVEIDGNGGLKIAGVKVRADEKVIQKQLLKNIFSINPTFLKKFGNITSEKTSNDLINLIKTALTLSDVKKSNITLLANPRTNSITNILPSTKSYISNSMAIEMFERTMNSDKDLTLVGASVSENGDLSFNVKKGLVVTPEVKSQKLVGEEFNPGFTLGNSITNGLSLESYVERLVCTNGMTQTKLFSKCKIEQLSDVEIQKFFQVFASIKANDFIPFNLGENISKASETRASFGELKKARAIIYANSDIKKETDLYSFLPQFQREVNKLASKGIDYTKCTDIQLNNHAVGCNVWEVVNVLTDFGSHDYGFNTNYNQVQKSAGELFNKKSFDTENVLVLN